MNRILCWFLLVGLLACDKPDEVVDVPNTPVMHFSVQVEGESGRALLLNEPFSVNDSVSLKVSDFSFYITDFSIQNTAGDWIVLQEAWLVSLYENQTQFQIQDERLTEAKKIRFNIGVPANINHANPADQPNTSAYSIQGAKGMHWGWETGYKFLALDGKAKLPGQAEFNQNVSLHAGTDELLRVVEYDIANLNFADEKPPFIVLFCEIASTFQGIDMAAESQSHTGSDKVTVTKMMDNFVESIEFAVAQE